MNSLKSRLNNQLNERKTEVLDPSIYVDSSRLSDEKYLEEVFVEIISTTDLMLMQDFDINLSPQQVGQLFQKAAARYEKFK